MQKSLTKRQENKPTPANWSSFKESLAILTMTGAIGCAHLYEKEARSLPLSPAAYSLDNSVELEHVDVGAEVNVVARATVYINDGKRQRYIVDYEKEHGPLNLTYCWFVYQDIGVKDENGPVFFLLNPRYNDFDQPRYVGAVKSYHYSTDQGEASLDVVLPAVREDVKTLEPMWRIGAWPRSREDALFYLQEGTFVPVVDNSLLRHLEGYCKETGIPEYAVTEYGPTFASLMVYPTRE